MKKQLISVSLLLLIFSMITACSMEVSKQEDINSPTTVIITATLPATFTPRASTTPLPLTALPTIEPIAGKVTAQINVRKSPSTASESLGMLGINSEVLIIGKDSNEKWYKIIFELANGESGEGWGSAQYILTDSKSEIPVVSGGSQSDNDEYVNGTVTQKINVRSGPGVEFDALGMIENGDSVILIGKNIDETWLEITYGSEKGWVFASYVQSDVIDALPIINESGEVIAESTQTLMAATANPTFLPAVDDGDSSEEPAISVIFSTENSRAFSYNSDLSSPEGDAEDWISFHPNSTEDRVNLLLDLSCEGNGSLYVELWQGGIKLKNWGDLKCGDKDYALSMFRDETYQFRLLAKRANQLEYINYTLQVRAAP